MGCCDQDIHTLHAELIHNARNIKFQLGYDNAGNPAIITDLENGKNLQFLLEQYFSKVGIPVVDEIPTGDKNSVNLKYETSEEFITGTLEVYLSGDKLEPMDFSVTTTGPKAYREFTLVLAPDNPASLNAPPFQDESLTVNYKKRITFNTKGGT